MDYVPRLATTTGRESSRLFDEGQVKALQRAIYVLENVHSEVDTAVAGALSDDTIEEVVIALEIIKHEFGDNLDITG